MNTDQNTPTTEKPLLGKSINSAISSNDSADTVDVKSSSFVDLLLWLVALSLLMCSTLVSQYLPAYWAPASNVWVKIAVTGGMIIVALALLYATAQGKGFVRLLSDARVELTRITWPTKNDTIHTTWIVLVVVVIMAILLWLMDMFFGWAIKLIIG
jgi:preprotein translocase subunit SecE